MREKEAKEIEVNPLRICIVCGCEAYTEEDLETFTKHQYMLYGRQNLCKKCERNRVSRTPKLIEVFRLRSPDGRLICYFCGEEVTKYEGQNRDSLAIHSLDGDHENWSLENKVPTHCGCHSSHHKIGEKNPRWQGDAASDRAKYMRGWERRRRLKNGVPLVTSETLLK